MKDTFGRKINYLRMSITDQCNLRCKYCMPEEDFVMPHGKNLLTLDELVDIAKASIKLGVNKIRLSGGEPLTRPDIVELCSELSRLDGLNDLAITTNGVLLKKLAGDLKAAGLSRVNISLDTLDPDKFHEITRIGSINAVLEGIDAALEYGLTPVKINSVLIGGFNDDEIPALAELTRTRPLHIRFIELMPMKNDGDFGPEAYIPNDTVLDKLKDLEEVEEDCIARIHKFPGAPGTIGLISPVSTGFCSSCNRIRLTADGCIKPCLHSSQEISVRGLKGQELEDKLAAAIASKPEKHKELSYNEQTEAARSMNRIGG